MSLIETLALIILCVIAYCFACLIFILFDEACIRIINLLKRWFPYERQKKS